MIYEQNTCDPQQTTDIINRPLITNKREIAQFEDDMGKENTIREA